MSNTFHNEMHYIYRPSVGSIQNNKNKGKGHELPQSFLFDGKFEHEALRNTK